MEREWKRERERIIQKGSEGHREREGEREKERSSCIFPLIKETPM
jgi:hypothetical protein